MNIKFTTALSTIYLLLVSSLSQAYEQGDWLVRGRVININPNETSSVVSSGTPLAPIAGSSVGVTDETILELDFTYMFTKNWGGEIILGTSKHDVPALGTIAANNNIINARALPPTLTLQYHFLPDGDIRPYAGVGINYTKFFSEKVTGGIYQSGAEVEMDSSWGLATQLGVDIALDKDWFINADLKRIDMDTTAHFTGTTLGAAHVDVDIDPVIFGIGIGRRF